MFRDSPSASPVTSAFLSVSLIPFGAFTVFGGYIFWSLYGVSIYLRLVDDLPMYS